MQPNIFPVMRYRDARASMAWLVRTFGFEKQVEYPGSDGTVAHAEIRFGTGVVGISSATPPKEDNPWSAVRQGLYVKVDDIDAHHERARGAGAEIMIPLRDTDYGSREYSARDLDGHVWGFGTYAMGAPDGEPDIFPELRYRNGPAAVRWLGAAFGFTATIEVPGPDGATVHAEMRLGDGVIMLNIGSGDDGTWGDLIEATNVYVADPDAHFARATAAGAAIVLPLTTTHYGARCYWARDPEGFLWGFSTYKPVGYAVAT
jgi:uncharacterized glyoxalase superfamily protein PhnB